MNKEVLINRKHTSFQPAILGYGIYFIALISSIVLVGTEQAIEIRRPWILLLVSLACVFSVKNSSFLLIQKLLMIYFLCMLISQLALEKMVLGGEALRFILPKTLIPLFFYMLSFIIFIPTNKITPILKKNQLWYWLWGIAVIILVVHMICLWNPLESIYGYGYEHNSNVLGNIVLYMMCFVFTWDILDKQLVRCLSFICLIIYLLIIIRESSNV